MKFLSGHILSIKPKILINYGTDYNFWNRLRGHLMYVYQNGKVAICANMTSLVHNPDLKCIPSIGYFSDLFDNKYIL